MQLSAWQSEPLVVPAPPSPSAYSKTSSSSSTPHLPPSASPPAGQARPRSSVRYSVGNPTGSCRPPPPLPPPTRDEGPSLARRAGRATQASSCHAGIVSAEVNLSPTSIGDAAAARCCRRSAGLRVHECCHVPCLAPPCTPRARRCRDTTVPDSASSASTALLSSSHG